MKKIILTLISFSFFIVTNAQVVTFLSLSSSTLNRGVNGRFADVKVRVVKQMHINLDLTHNKLQFFSKGLLDRDTFSLQKEIFILDKTTANVDNEQTRAYSGIDQVGRKCIIKFKASKDEINNQEGKLQIEYLDHAKIYELTKLRNDPFLN